MGLLEQVNYTGENKPINPVTPTVPDIEGASPDQFKVDIPNQTSSKLFENLKSTQNMGQEGIASGNEAADALFNNNTSTFSRALSSRANRMMAVNKSTRTLNNELHNVQRQQLQQNQNMNDLNDIYKIKRQNFAGQLKFASEMSNYYNQLSGLKLQALGSIIGGGFAVAGKVAGGA